ncbi:ferredoxin--NADP reductase [Thioalkalivibrio sp. ALE23]|uniref:ferredoxin--NADP reductase n=1 Tax=Thioalkalivibrio sp. ALE23 TaxID=1265495 RepID=UPI00037070FD|nr:ferredoxin--NADP reductase [Thioalkalivibrio sp. ALE23]
MPYSEQQITSLHRWSDKTFSFTTTRPEGFEFHNGQFVTLGLRPEGKLIPRAYSIVSDPSSEELEFLSIHVPDGDLTSRLAHVEPGDSIWINNKVTGSLTVDYVQPGRHLYMLATGTGIAPFVSLVRSDEVFEHFERVILVHSVRTVEELAYREELEAKISDRFRYMPTVTREDHDFACPVAQQPFDNNQRGAELFRSGELFRALDLPPADPEQDRVMLCGNPAMNREMSQWLEEHGWVQTSYKGTGTYTVEQAFVTTMDDADD